MEVAKDRLIQLLSCVLAQDSIGLYPASAPGKYEARTERMEGFNEAILETNEIACWIEEFLNGLPDLALQMLADEDLFVQANRAGESTLWVPCSDFFFWGTADGERITVEELPELDQCRHEAPGYGFGRLLWVARKRKMRPQWAYYAHIPEALWPLFDQAGPERTDPDGLKRIKPTPVA